MLIVRIVLWSIILTVSGGAIADASIWASTNEKQSKIYLALEISKNYSKTGWDEGYTRRRYRILVINKLKSDPRGEIYFDELSPGRFYPSINGPKKTAPKFGYFKEGFTAVSDEQFHKNHQMNMHYMVVSVYERQCVVFVGKSGEGGGDGQLSQGTAALFGYYCNPVDRALEPTGIAKILNAVGIKNVGEYAPPAF